MTTTLEVLCSENIHRTLERACAEAVGGGATFEFNGHTFTVFKGESFESAKSRWEALTGFAVRTPEQMAEAARLSLEKMERDSKAAIASAGVMTEAQLRECDAPWPKTPEELAAYITSLIDRPHDYGTCVYAMSLSAVAAFQYVAGKLGVTGFQASCADMNFIGRTRNMKLGFKISDYANLLYPQYLSGDHFPSAADLLNKEDLRERLRVEAEKLLKESTEHTHPDVLAHWKRIVSNAQF